MNPRIRYFQAAGITIKVVSEYPITDNTFLPKFKLFEVDGPGEDNVCIHHYFHPYDNSKINLIEKKPIFSNDQWKIFKTDNSWIYQFNPVFPGEPGSPVTVNISRDHSNVDVFSDTMDKNSYQNGRHNALTLFNSDQVFFSKLLCDRSGLILHSNGFNWKNKGFLLAGQSGAGKSTLSNMLKQQNFEILCDDRMFIKKDRKIFHIHGSWCHGSVPDAAQISVPLKAIFFLNQSKENKSD